MKDLSLRVRLMTAILLTTGIALVVSSIAKVSYNLKDYRERVTQEALTQANLLGRAVTPALQFQDVDSARNYLDLFKNQPSILEAAIYTERGVLFADYSTSAVEERNFVNYPENNIVRVDGNSLIISQKIVANNEIIGFVFVRVLYDFYPKLVGNVLISVGVTVLAMLVAFFVSIRLQRSITEPLESIIALSKNLVKSKDYSLRVEANSRGEIGALIDAYNEMLDEVEQRKRQLEVANKELGNEILERREAEKALKESEEKVLHLNANLEKRVHDRTQQLEVANKELEAFSYSVSHDLRTPLRAIDGFSQAVLEDYEDKLDEEGRDSLLRVRQAAQRMGELIDDMLKLSRVSRADINVQPVDLSKMAEQLLEEIKQTEPERQTKISITSGLQAECDFHLIKIALANLLGNAWKYSARCEITSIEFGLRQRQGEPVFFIQDNGVGFDMAYADRLFGAFQRLHSAAEFSGSGIGLATVKRVISRHRGKIWAESSPNQGAVFYFTLPPCEEVLDQLDGDENDEYKANLAGRR